jgi:hypothetical protein
MSCFEKTVEFWRCDFADCKYEWLRRQDPKPRICPNCDRRGWDRVESTKPARVAIPVPVWRPKLATRISAEEFKRRTKQLPEPCSVAARQPDSEDAESLTASAAGRS